MSETTNTPGQDDEQGTFVGGSFGSRATEDTEDAATTAERLEAHEVAGLELAGGVDDASAEPTAAGVGAIPAGGVEDIASGSTGGVEDVSAEPSPGERNEPV